MIRVDGFDRDALGQLMGVGGAWKRRLAFDRGDFFADRRPGRARPAQPIHDRVVVGDRYSVANPELVEARELRRREQPDLGSILVVPKNDVLLRRIDLSNGCRHRHGAPGFDDGLLRRRRRCDAGDGDDGRRDLPGDVRHAARRSWGAKRPPTKISTPRRSVTMPTGSSTMVMDMPTPSTIITNPTITAAARPSTRPTMSPA